MTAPSCSCEACFDVDAYVSMDGQLRDSVPSVRRRLAFEIINGGDVEKPNGDVNEQNESKRRRGDDGMVVVDHSMNATSLKARGDAALTDEEIEDLIILQLCDQFEAEASDDFCAREAEVDKFIMEAPIEERDALVRDRARMEADVTVASDVASGIASSSRNGGVV